MGDLKIDTNSLVSCFAGTDEVQRILVDNTEIWALSTTSQYVYCIDRYSTTYQIRKIDKTTWTVVATSPVVNSRHYSGLYSDGNHLYAHDKYTINKFDLDDLSHIAMIDVSTFTAYSINQGFYRMIEDDSGNLIAMTYNPVILFRINKSTFSFVEEMNIGGMSPDDTASPQMEYLGNGKMVVMVSIYAYMFDCSPLDYNNYDIFAALRDDDGSQHNSAVVDIVVDKDNSSFFICSRSGAVAFYDYDTSTPSITYSHVHIASNFGAYNNIVSAVVDGDILYFSEDYNGLKFVKYNMATQTLISETAQLLNGANIGLHWASVPIRMQQEGDYIYATIYNYISGMSYFGVVELRKSDLVVTNYKILTDIQGTYKAPNTTDIVLRNNFVML